MAKNSDTEISRWRTAMSAAVRRGPCRRGRGVGTDATSTARETGWSEAATGITGGTAGNGSAATGDCVSSGSAPAGECVSDGRAPAGECVRSGSATPTAAVGAANRGPAPAVRGGRAVDFRLPRPLVFMASFRLCKIVPAESIPGSTPGDHTGRPGGCQPLLPMTSLSNRTAVQKRFRVSPLESRLTPKNALPILGRMYRNARPGAPRGVGSDPPVEP